ncbi:hypothetical protein [Streptosporangium carneum]|uniref:Uncharacterized protein n=1 Tax=Streptosporangium carneum TaxID=47481 RepID=A0A9W6HX85_9ACTN|nr:hypothetical protein [Streptosporangium carneum]GLK07334.1 hypothetical protein GCM10017600_07390 [Streptosporangium carneum]
MLKRLIVSIALVVAAFVPATAMPAAASIQGGASAATAACTYQRSGNHWNCITPGAYCPKAAHNRYGYAKVTNRRYKCSQYDNGQWRWKRA